MDILSDVSQGNLSLKVTSLGSEISSKIMVRRFNNLEKIYRVGIHGGNIRAASEKYSIKVEKIIDFSANINPLCFPEYVRTIIDKNISSLVHYPDCDCKNLIKQLAKHLRIHPSNILAGNGSTEIIYLITRTLQPKKTLICLPTFSEYEISAKSIGSEIVYIKTDKWRNFSLDLEQILKYIPKVDLVFLCNPNNPTGTIIPKSFMTEIINKCEMYRTFLTIDEAFMDFVDNGEELSNIKLAVSKKSLIVIKSLTKIFGIPGIRLGYCVTNKTLINMIKKFQYPWSVNSLAQHIGEKLIADINFLERSKEFIKKEKIFLYNELKKIKFIKTYPSFTNFILCELKNTKLTAGMLTDILGKKGILIRNCSNFKGLNNKFFRVAVRKREDNIKLIKSLNECFEKSFDNTFYNKETVKINV